MLINKNKRFKYISPSMLHVTLFPSRKGGGVCESVLGMAKELSDMGVTIELFGSKEKNGNSDLKEFNFPLKYYSTIPFPGMTLIPGLINGFKKSEKDILHLHGLWNFCSVAALFWDKTKPKVITPHGMLNSFAIRNYSLWKKKIALLL